MTKLNTADMSVPQVGEFEVFYVYADTSYNFTITAEILLCSLVNQI